MKDLDYYTFMKLGFTSLFFLFLGFSIIAFLGDLIGIWKVEINTDGGINSGTIVVALVTVVFFLMTIAWVSLTVMYWALKHLKS